MRRSKTRSPFSATVRVALWGVLLLASASDLLATCTTIKKPSAFWFEPIGIVHDARIPRSIVEEAIDMWGSCGGYADTIPRFVVGRSPGRTVEIAFSAQGPEGKCGSFRGNRITLFAVAEQADGRRSRCGSLAQNLAHELGHVLGLRDGLRSDRCAYHVMARITAWNARARRVQPDECRAVGTRWSRIDLSPTAEVLARTRLPTFRENPERAPGRRSDESPIRQVFPD